MGAEDVFSALFSIECKSRDKLPVFITKTYAQAEKNKVGENKIVLAQLHETNKNHLDDFIVIKMKDFLSLLERFSNA